ncbi:hypothetical protein ColTof4_01466 [Colletotrichum tofieldiae]|nr:hypothetical protein ColTof3_08722 [Colletotrichum tofieldiae]GKT69043.1 hypothetical protein ColTof4_01466 [Colletotrichum tofieldiae]GKT96910.1 hypothetical protein Ct61P_14760 [Colletotrichum tofieldiae]
MFFSSGSYETIREIQTSAGAEGLAAGWSQYVKALKQPEKNTRVWHWACYWAWCLAGITSLVPAVWRAIASLFPEYPVLRAASVFLALAAVVTLLHFGWRWFSPGALIVFAAQSFTTLLCLFKDDWSSSRRSPVTPVGTRKPVGGVDDGIILPYLGIMPKPVFQQADVSRTILWDIVATHAWLGKRFGAAAVVGIASLTDHKSLAMPSSESVESIFSSFAAVESIVDAQ